MADQNDVVGLNDDQKKVSDRVCDGVFPAMKEFNGFLVSAETTLFQMQVLRHLIAKSKSEGAEEGQKAPE